MRYKFSGTFRDGSGNVVNGGTVSVYASGTTTASSIYETETGTTIVNSTTTGTDGTFTFYILESDYYEDHTRKIVLSKAGYTSKTYDYSAPNEFVNGPFTQAAINSALAAIGTTNKATLLLRPGTWVISSTADWSAYTNVTFKIVPGAILSGAFTVTFPANAVEAGLYKIFAGGIAIVGPKTVYPEWWGAVGDASTNDYAALAAMVTATPAYATVELNSIYKIASQWTITKNLSFSGIGTSSGFYLAIDTSTDGILLGNVESSSGDIQFIKWLDFGIYGNTSSCRNALVLTGVMRSRFENIHIKAGTHATGYGVWARWCIENYFGFVIDYLNYYPVTAVTASGGFKASHSDGTSSQTFNDNTIDVIIDGKTGKGIYLIGGSDNLITGISTGITGYGLHLEAGDRNHIENFYSEASVGVASGNEIILEDETNTKIGGGVISIPGLAYADVQLVGSSNIIIDGLFCSMLNIDATTIHTRILHITTSGNVSSAIVDNGLNTIQVIADTTSPDYPITGLLSDFNSVIYNGSFERWTSTSVPAGPTWANIGATITRETSIIAHGISSAKIDTTGTDASAIRLSMPSNLFTFNPRGKTTITGWVYIPTVGGQNLIISTWYDNGAATKNGAVISTRDAWTKVSLNIDNTFNAAYASYQLYFYTTLAGTFYLDGWSVIPGVAGGASYFTPNAFEFPKLTGSGTWDPGSIAASGYEAKDFTVLGASLGMIAQAGAGVDVTDLIVSATVTVANTVTVVLFNPTVGAVDLASSTWRVMAIDISQ